MDLALRLGAYLVLVLVLVADLQQNGSEDRVCVEATVLLGGEVRGGLGHAGGSAGQWTARRELQVRDFYQRSIVVRVTDPEILVREEGKLLHREFAHWDGHVVVVHLHGVLLV